MAQFQPPPTFALPVNTDENTKAQEFNPIWLDWFYRLLGFLNGSGVIDGTISYTEQTLVAGQSFARQSPLPAPFTVSQNVLINQSFARATPTPLPFDVTQNIIAGQVFGG